MSIRYKLFLSIMGVALLFVSVNLFLATRYGKIQRHFFSLVDTTLPRLEILLAMQNLTSQINLNIQHSYYKFNQTEAYHKEFLSLLNQFEQTKNIYQQNSLKNEQLFKLNRLRDEIMKSASYLFSHKNKKISEISQQEMFQYFLSKEKELNELIKQILSWESNHIKTEKAKTIKSAKEFRRLFVLLNYIIIVVTFLLSLFLTRVISKPIITLSRFANNIDYDNLNPLLPILSKDEIGKLQANLNTMLVNLDKAKRNVIETSRSAGMAEIATSILHNVGNVLNSVNTSVALLLENTERSHLPQLRKLERLLENNINQIDYFLNNDERGKLCIPYFKKLVDTLLKEKQEMQEELRNLSRHILHINQVIALQQESGKLGYKLIEPIQIEELIEEILVIYTNSIRKTGITIERHYDSTPDILSIKAKIQQILINLIKNAIDALKASSKKTKKLIIKLAYNHIDNGVLITIQDNGIGIAPEHLKHIFSFGFTTKAEGHGYGLHNSAVLAQELGGHLEVSSKGLNKGASFSICVPCKMTNQET